MRAMLLLAGLMLVVGMPSVAADEDLEFGATGGPCTPRGEGTVTFPGEPPVTPPITPPVPPFTDPPVPLPGDNPVGPIVVGAINRCGVSQAGSLEVAGCDETGCTLAGASQAVGWSTSPAFLQVESRVRTNLEPPFGFCVAQSLGTQTITCAGHREDIAAAVAPGACTDLVVETDLQMLSVETNEERITWASHAQSDLRLCRDEDGTPHLMFGPEGGAPAAPAAWVLVAMVALTTAVARSRGPSK